MTTGDTTGINSGLTIADQPILVDSDGEAQSWLDRFMPESSIFQPPQVDVDQFLSGPDGSSNGDFFKSSLPELPPIKIGQIQWPCVGASRYARGLFLVDRIALFEILHVAWGQSIPETFPYPIPDDWVQTKNRPVSVFLAPGVAVGEDPPIDFTLWMYVLLPIRVSDDLWILPLVDGRYFRLTDCKKNTVLNESAPTKTWQDLFDVVSTGAGIKYKIVVDYADDAEAAMGHPDTVCADPQVPTSFVVDAACFSIGRRPVVLYPTDAEVDCDFPEDSQLGVIAQKAADAETTKAETIANDTVTGGVSGKSRRPRSLKVSTRYCPQFYSGTNDSYSYKKNLSTAPRNGIDLFCKAVWNTIDDVTAAIYTTGYNSTKTAFEAYVSIIATKLNEWNIEEYYVSFPDIIQVTPSGFDDYIIYESSGEKKTTTVRSLPIDFVNPFLLGQAPSGPGFDNTTDQTKWFRTSNQTVVGIVKLDIPKATVTGGFRDYKKGNVWIHGPGLIVNSGSALVLNRAEVYAIATEKSRVLPVGTLVHLAWVDDTYNAGDGNPDAHWIVDWADCDG